VTTTPKGPPLCKKPMQRCCCTREATGRHVETPSQKQLLRARGPPTRLTARLTLSCAGTAQTRRTAPHSRLVSKIVVEVAQRGAPPSKPNQAAGHHRGSNHLVASPSRKPPPSSQKSKDVACAVTRHCTAPEKFSRAEQPRRNPLQAMSPLAADAASAVRRRCPAPHRGVPSNPSRRRTLQADESAAEKRPSDSNCSADVEA
jgi:hypothetical protein